MKEKEKQIEELRFRLTQTIESMQFLEKAFHNYIFERLKLSSTFFDDDELNAISTKIMFIEYEKASRQTLEKKLKHERKI